MQISVITLFPELVKSVIAEGVVGRAAKRGLVELNCVNPRDYTEDIHRTVDDRPYGGGPGMVMRPDCLLKSIRAERKRLGETKVVYLTPQGRPIKQDMLKSLSEVDSVVLLCGRYEGIDERVIDLEVDEEWSLGDFVLSGGELAAMVVVDGVTRLLPEALGHDDSALEDSFSDGLLDHPHYTRPEKIEDLEVPEVLLSGNHQHIKKWRRKQALGRTYLRRPDVLQEKDLSKQDMVLLDDFMKEIKTSEVKS
ncbi:tRNA (guanosine(37)-N1)-methyltransferase TrmD [Leucothrix pacifica]|uniref:tRNA (guanine-N(1)-)-methyltransferase n=1 Tax=Leucothrix pacifica TaxID=1247513 RepID=A0A317CUS1_9GAMM|nr:tRNA (guanosine(37)-N1)-methyltransferase TrmD [Leucothrix pacifica]PWR00073.1 tRNA (guanosine(37)-N1)-methyltransferase TrmD [Leucothrix pacifica]